MLKVEAPGGVFLAYYGIFRSYRHLIIHRVRYLWLVIRGKATLSDAIQNLAKQRAYNEAIHVLQLGLHLRDMQWRGATGAEVEIARMNCKLANDRLQYMIKHNNFYQDSLPYLSPAACYILTKKRNRENTKLSN